MDTKMSLPQDANHRNVNQQQHGIMALQGSDSEETLLLEYKTVQQQQLEDESIKLETNNKEVAFLGNDAQCAEQRQVEDENEIISLKATVELLIKELHTCKSELDASKTRENNLKISILNLETDLSAKTRELAKAVDEIYNTKKNVSLLNNKLNKKEADESEAKNTASETLKHLEEMKIKMSEISSENESLKNKVESQMKENEKIHSESYDTNLKYVQLQQEISDKCKEVSDWRQRHASTESVRQSLEDELKTQTDTVTALKGEIKDLLNQRAAQEEALALKQTALLQREQSIQETEEFELFKTQMLAKLEYLEQDLKRVYAENKDLRAPPRKSATSCTTRPKNQEDYILQISRFKETMKKNEEGMEEMRKELSLSYIKIGKLETELMEHGNRNRKRAYQENTMTSLNKQRVQASSGQIATTASTSCKKIQSVLRTVNSTPASEAKISSTTK